MSDEELVKRPLDEQFDTMMEVQRNPCGAWQAIQTLTEQLEAARADAKEAEAYADELAGDQVDLCRQLIAAEDKLAKAVSWLETIRDRAKGDYMANTYYLDALAALAEIEGSDAP
jgi:hypothetical protein